MRLPLRVREQFRKAAEAYYEYRDKLSKTHK
nr:MAG TPA: hypothetical protein [Caudoviricetes sp.]